MLIQRRRSTIDYHRWYYVGEQFAQPYSDCGNNDYLKNWGKNAIESKAFLSKSMYIVDLNQYAIELVSYLLVLAVYFYELMVCMLFERNAFDSISFFSQCSECTRSIQSLFSSGSRLQNTNVCTTLGVKQAQHFSDHEKINFQTVDVQGPPTV